jgi:hypothetical protein
MVCLQDSEGDLADSEELKAAQAAIEEAAKLIEC